MDGDFKGDFTRDSFSFDPQRRRQQFSRLLMQQGRVLLDADWNEQADLFLFALRTFITDLVGPHWGVFDFDTDSTGGITVKGISPNSFKIAPLEVDGADKKCNFSIKKGRYYVDGILVENTGDITYREQEPK